MKALKSFDDVNGRSIRKGDDMEPADYQRGVIAHYQRHGMVDATDGDVKKGGTDAEALDDDRGPRHKTDPTNPIPSNAAKVPEVAKDEDDEAKEPKSSKASEKKPVEPKETK